MMDDTQYNQHRNHSTVMPRIVSVGKPAVVITT